MLASVTNAPGLESRPASRDSCRLQLAFKFWCDFLDVFVKLDAMDALEIARYVSSPHDKKTHIRTSKKAKCPSDLDMNVGTRLKIVFLFGLDAVIRRHECDRIVSKRSLMLPLLDDRVTASGHLV